VLTDFQLTDNGMPADVDFVPGIFEAAQGRIVHFADVTERWRGGNERMGLFPCWGAGFDGGEDGFQLLDDYTFDFEKLLFIFRPEFFGARETDETVELLPTLEVGLQLLNEVVQFLVAHRSVGMVSVLCMGKSLRRQEDDGATAHFAGGNF
jgi:hypothetical protein